MEGVDVGILRGLPRPSALPQAAHPVVDGHAHRIALPGKDEQAEHSRHDERDDQGYDAAQADQVDDDETAGEQRRPQPGVDDSCPTPT